MPTLVSPSQKYQDSYLEALREYQTEGRKSNENFEAIKNNFEAYIQSIHDEADQTKIPEGRVPSSRFWLIFEGHYVGELNIRPELNEELQQWGGHIGYTIRPSRRKQGYGKRILELGLLLAPSFGLKRILITCDSDNVASRKIIEHNGGQFENELAGEWKGQALRRRRYWIDLQ